MIKKWMFYIGIIVLVVFVSSGFKTTTYLKQNWFDVNKNQEFLYQFPSQHLSDYLHNSIPFKGKYFIGFKEAIAFKESQGKYNKVNSLGYMGKYQFGKTTLASLGITDSIEFLNNPLLQEKAFVALLKKNKWELRKVINKYRGTVVDGVRITESGLLAAAHLGGAGSVRKYLASNGQKKCKDSYGTSVKSYMKQFGGFETHNIKAERNPKID